MLTSKERAIVESAYSQARKLAEREMLRNAKTAEDILELERFISEPMPKLDHTDRLDEELVAQLLKMMTC